jgi:type III secretion protein L
MVIWLDHATRDSLSLGIEGGVLKGEDFATLMDVTATLAQARADAEAALSEAHDDASSVLERARQQAIELTSELEVRLENSSRLGYADGLQRGIDEVHRSIRNQVNDQRQNALSLQQRLAEIVMKAVEQVILETDRAALFTRVGWTLARVIDTHAYVTLTVSESDRERAFQMLEKLAAEHGTWTGGFDVQVDPKAHAGNCVCEWDCGVLDASLDGQLEALSRAILEPANIVGGSDFPPTDFSETGAHPEELENSYEGCRGVA